MADSGRAGPTGKEHVSARPGRVGAIDTRNDPTTQYAIVLIEHGRLTGAQRALRSIKLDVQSPVGIRSHGRGDRRSCISNLDLRSNWRIEPVQPNEIDVFHHAGLLKQVLV